MPERDRSNTGATLVIEHGVEKPVETSLAPAKSRTPAASSRPEQRDANKSLMTPDQQAAVATISENLQKRVIAFQSIRQAESKEVHAAIISEGAKMVKLIADVDGERAALGSLGKVWNTFLDVRSTPESHDASIVMYRDRVEQATMKVNSKYRQFFTIWNFLIRIEGGFYREGEMIPQTTIRLHGQDYRTPSEACAGGNTLTDVYTAWKNVVRPTTTVLDEYPTRGASKQLFEDAVVAVAKFGIITRQKIEFIEDGQKRTRMQKVKVSVVPSQRNEKATALPPAAWAGVFAGLLAHAHRQGVISQMVDTAMGKMSFMDFVKGELEHSSIALADTKDDPDNDELDEAELNPAPATAQALKQAGQVPPAAEPAA